MSWFVVLKCRVCGRFYGMDDEIAYVSDLRSKARAAGWVYTRSIGDRCPPHARRR